ncbi:hypothetical protein STEG23_018184 [Scotinomys teguina]
MEDAKGQSQRMGHVLYADIKMENRKSKGTVFDYSRGTGNGGTFISTLHCYGPSRKNPTPISKEVMDDMLLTAMAYDSMSSNFFCEAVILPCKVEWSPSYRSCMSPIQHFVKQSRKKEFLSQMTSSTKKKINGVSSMPVIVFEVNQRCKEQMCLIV